MYNFGEEHLFKKRPLGRPKGGIRIHYTLRWVLGRYEIGGGGDEMAQYHV